MVCSSEISRATASDLAIVRSLELLDNNASPVATRVLAKLAASIADRGRFVPSDCRWFTLLAQLGLIDPDTGEIFDRTIRVALCFAEEHGEDSLPIGIFS